MNENNKPGIGNKAPLFLLKDQSANQVRLEDYIGKQTIIIYFYPKDFTPGCIAEACQFRDDYGDFEEKSVRIFGISSDSIKTHKRFAKKYALPFQLLSDPGNKVRESYGAKTNNPFFQGRITFVIDKHGIIVERFRSQMMAKKHVTVALKAIQNINWNTHDNVG